MNISFNEICKIIDLLISKDLVNRELGVIILKQLGILKDFQDDCVHYLARLQKHEYQHNFLKQLIKIIEDPKLKIYESSRSWYINIFTLNSERAYDLRKIRLRQRGEFFNDFLLNGSVFEVFEIANYVSTLQAKYKRFHVKYEQFDFSNEFLKILENQRQKESVPNIFSIKKYPFEEALKTGFEEIIITDFPFIELNADVLSKLKGKTLKMRRGYYLRNEKLFVSHPQVRIIIDTHHYLPTVLIPDDYSNKAGRMNLLDKNIFKGKYLVSISNTPQSLFPNELSLYSNLEVIFFSNMTMKILPYRIMRCKNLKYLIFSTFKPKIKIHSLLSSHPTLKGVIFQYKTSDYKGIKEHGYNFLPIENFSLVKNGVLDLISKLYIKPLDDEQNLLIDILSPKAKKITQTAIYNQNIPAYLPIKYPMDVFKSTTFECKILLDEQIEMILERLYPSGK